jgi:hypothetical protein
MNRDIKKISWDSERVKIKFEVPRTDGVDEYEMSCVDAPAPTLTAALSNLRRHVADICELPEGFLNACSMLYGACWRAARSLGYRRLGTYIRKDEPGTSLRAAGWRLVAETRARSWEKSNPSRPRVDKTEIVQRQLWEATA